MNKTETD